MALSLLLVFRTNAAYGRWDESRKMQGLLVNRSRDLVCQVCVFGGGHKVWGLGQDTAYQAYALVSAGERALGAGPGAGL